MSKDEVCRHYRNNQCQVDMSDCDTKGNSKTTCYEKQPEPNIMGIPMTEINRNRLTKFEPRENLK